MLIDHLWQSTVFGAMVLAALAALRPLPARTRRTLAWLALLKFLIPAAWFTPIIRAFDPAAAAAHWLAPMPYRVPVLSKLAAAASGDALPPPVTGALHAPMRQAENPGETASRNHVVVILQAIWLTGAAALLLSSIVSAVRLRRRLRAQAAPAPEAVRARVDRAAALAGLNSPPECLGVAEDESPGILGLFRPILVIPRGLENSLSTDELDAVLLHECVHLSRGDTVAAAVQAALVSLLWFDPVVWLLSRRIDRDTEMACDEAVLAAVPNETFYLTGLAKTARHTLGLVHAGFAPAGSTPVGERLANIRHYRQRRAPHWANPLVLGAAALGIVLSGYAGSLTGAALGPHGVSLPEADAKPPARSLVLNFVNRQRFALEPAQLDLAPAPVAEVTPAFPADLRATGISGDAVVDFVVDGSGAVTDASVQAFSRPQFKAASLAAIAQWKFRPGEKDGRPAATHLRLHFYFSASTGQVGLLGP